MRKVIIFGTGDGGPMLRAFLEFEATRTPVAYTADRRFVTESTFDGLPVYPFDEIEQHCPPASHGLFVAVGHLDRNRVRARAFDEASAKGYEIESFIDPSVRRFPSATIARGCLIFDHVTVQPYAQIGENVMVRPLAYIGHHATVEPHCFIAPHAVLLGRSRIGASTFVAAHATVSSGVTIGPRSVVGAGAVVTHDVPANSIVRRTP